MTQFIYCDFNDETTNQTNHGAVGGNLVPGYGKWVSSGDSFTTYDFHKHQSGSNYHANSQIMSGEFGSSGGGTVNGSEETTSQHGICCSCGTGTTYDDTASITWVVGFHWRGNHTGNPARILCKGIGLVNLEIRNDGYLRIYHACSAGAVYWYSSSAIFSAGHDYYLEVRWTRGTPTSPGTPHVHLYTDQSGTKSEISLGSAQGNLSGSWTATSSYWWYLANYSAGSQGKSANSCTASNGALGGDHQLWGSFYVVRMLDEYLDHDTSYYSTDFAKWTDVIDRPISITTVPNCTADDVTPTKKIETTHGADVTNCYIEWDFNRSGSDDIPNTRSPGTYDLDNVGGESEDIGGSIYDYIFNGSEGDYADSLNARLPSTGAYTIEVLIKIDDLKDQIILSAQDTSKKGYALVLKSDVVGGTPIYYFAYNNYQS